MEKKKILIVSKQLLFVKGVFSVLKEHEWNYSIDISVAINYESFMEKIRTNHIDMVIFNCTDLHEECYQMLNDKICQAKAILILNKKFEEELKDLVYQKNVDGVISSSSSESQLCVAINTVLMGEKYFSQDIVNFLLKLENSNEDYLTNREKDILYLIAGDFSTKEISEKLFISNRTVEAHRNSIKEKFQVKNIHGIVMEGVKRGYIKI